MEFLARQPIFDTRQNVVAYELLFRNSRSNRCNETDLDLASRRMMSTALLLGLDLVAGGRSIYVNCTANLLLGQYATLLPPAQTVVEVLETVPANSDILSACRELKQAGYRIALDDFVDRQDQRDLIDVADVIKVDLRLTSSSERQHFIRRYRSPQRVFLAEKVETHEEFAETAEHGYDLFQGYFFCRPTILSLKAPRSLNPQHLRLLRLLGTPQLNLREVEELVKTDPALCFRLLRYLNSAAFDFHGEIRSILEAVMLLGETELRKWLFLMSALVSGRNPELVKLALVRARFAELLSPELRQPASLCFLLGLLSAMDAILDIPMLAVTQQLAIPAELRCALLGEEGMLRDCLAVVLAYEAGEWQRCEELREQYRVSPKSLVRSYFEALHWTESLVK
jgi:c-di-GMP-related signal transduction protein